MHLSVPLPIALCISSVYPPVTLFCFIYFKLVQCDQKDTFKKCALSFSFCALFHTDCIHAYTHAHMQLHSAWST
uniref:Uncharacterized protein n=1 Tax=Rhizophora mucronata TaxID=61149 RepID=A0A2P2QQ55_RHIMU